MVSFTLKQLGYFSAVAEHGGIAQAARALNISVPAVAAGIDKLEQLLGYRLLVRRHARGTEPTLKGREALLLVRELLARADDADRRLRALGARVEGALRLGCYETLAPFYLPGLIDLMRRQHPSVTCTVSEGRTEKLLAALAMADIEIALLYDMDLDRHGIAVERVASLAPYVLLPAGHALAGEASVGIGALAEEPYVQLDWRTTREHFSTIFERANIAPPVAFRSPSFELVRSAVANGLGFSLLYVRPDSDVAYDGKAIICLPIEEAMPPLDIVLAWPSRGTSRTIRTAFVDVATAYFAGR